MLEKFFRMFRRRRQRGSEDFVHEQQIEELENVRKNRRIRECKKK